MGAVDLGVGHVLPVVHHGMDDFARALGREAPVGAEGDHQEFRPGAGQGTRQVVVVILRGIEVVERLGHAQVGIGVEHAGKLVALVAQVGLDLELHVETVAAGAGAQAAAEFLGHLVVREIGDVAQHARQAQAAQGAHAVFVEVAAVKIRVGQDRLAGDVVEGDVFRRQLGRRGDDQGMADAIGIGQRPLQRLHAAQAAAHHRRPGVDAEVVGEPRLRVDPVFDGDHREIRAPGLAGGGVGAGRAGGPVAAAEVVQADDEEAVGIERPAGADDVVPPADVGRGFAGLVGAAAGDVVMAGQRMADEDGVRFRGVERAVGFIHQVEGGQHAAALQSEGLVEVRALRADDADTGHCEFQKTWASENRNARERDKPAIRAL